MSAVLLDEAETVLADVVALIDADGRRTAAELARLRRAQAHARRALLHDETERVKEQLSGPDGLEGVRARRSIRAYYRDSSWLRLVVVNDDPEPSPSGPAKKEAA